MKIELLRAFRNYYPTYDGAIIDEYIPHEKQFEAYYEFLTLLKVSLEGLDIVIFKFSNNGLLLYLLHEDDDAIKNLTKNISFLKRDSKGLTYTTTNNKKSLLYNIVDKDDLEKYNTLLKRKLVLERIIFFN